MILRKRWRVVHVASAITPHRLPVRNFWTQLGARAFVWNYVRKHPCPNGVSIEVERIP